MSNEHSPLPWSIESGFAVVDANLHTVAAFSAAYPEGPIDMDCDDAEFIVTACNAHAGLVDALKKLAETDGSYDNVRNAEVLAARVRKVASDALTSAGVK